MVFDTFWTGSGMVFGGSKSLAKKPGGQWVKVRIYGRGTQASDGFAEVLLKFCQGGGSRGGCSLLLPFLFYF